MYSVKVPKMTESSKMKHSYSLTSLSTRFLNGHSQQLGNGLGVHQSNGGHVKDSLEHETGDDYGFLSFRDQDLQQVPPTTKSSGQLLRNSSFYSTSTSYLNNLANASNGNPTARQPVSISQMHGNNTLQPQYHLSNSLYNNNNNEPTPGATGRQHGKQKLPSSCGNSGSLSLCGCDCHRGGLKHNKTELFRNNFNSNKRDSCSNNLKMNAATSCQTLNLCSTNSNNMPCCNTNQLNGSSMYGIYSSSNNNNNHNSIINANNPEHHNNSHTMMGVESRNTTTTNTTKNPSVRVRRTLSCYAKNPSRNDVLEGNLALLASKKDFIGGSTNAIAPYSSDSNGSSTASGSNHQQLPTVTNPCEFSPYSSLSSSDLLGLRLSNGYIDKRYSSSINNGANGLSSVFFHDNPVDCGCALCFQTKLGIFQANQKKPAQPLLPITNGQSNKDESTSSPINIPNGNSNTLTTSVITSYASKTQDNSDITWPLTPEEAVGYFSSRLTSWELSEISKYPQSWYIGQDAVRKINGEKSNPLNGGFDDENGNYHKVTRDHLAYRYEILEVIGKGSFGQVIRATDHKTQGQVAIKIIRNKKRFHAQALVEVKILEHLRKRDHDNTVIRMFSSFYFRNHLCIVFELMSLNLYELIRRNHYHGFSTGLIRKFAVSLLKCLALLKKENIIHCDLKPENILLRRRGSSAIKVIDFGSSCFGHERVFSYIQSRFYRAPEVILGIPYTGAIDVFSLGCVLAELSTGYPIFPGENEVEQLSCIMETLGPPPDALINVATRRRLFFDSRNQPRCIRNSKGKIRRPGTKDLSTAIKSEDLDFISFLRKCLTWDPQERLTPAELLQEPWITSGANGVVPTQVSRKNYV